jgi:DNA-binding CsgD family transcriptional regulator
MKQEIIEYTVDEIKEGFRFEKKDKKYICNHCGREFIDGEIHHIDGRFFESRLAVKFHMQSEHQGQFSALLEKENKYLTLTENQITILRLIHKGLSDNEIAGELGVSPSTIRHQKFMFREKAKQAKMYLAAYELVFVEPTAAEKLVSIHNSATMVDDRYITTEEEGEKIIKTAFSSLTPLRLAVFPAKEKKKIIILKKITELFEYGKRYQESELNEILKRVYEDFVTLRRYLIEYGFMDRTKDCTEYWLK